MAGLVQPVSSTGFTVIHEANNARADIVFVHGIQGHPFKTWAVGEQDHSGPRGLKKLFSRSRARSPAPLQEVGLAYWPRDFLPDDHSSTRVLTFGYDSHVSNFTKGPADQTNIFGHAKNLLYALVNLRRTCRGRDIIFICHSLGGIVVKEVLRRSDGDNAPDVQDIARSAKGVLFLGTPHRGGHYTGLAEMARRVVSAVGLDTGSQNLQALAFDSIELELSREEFGKLWKKHQWQVRTFQESTPLLGFRGGRDKVVPDFSSLLDDPSERAQHIPGNHMTMCRFTSKTDPGYRQVSAEVGSILDQPEVAIIASAIPQLEQQSGTASDAELHDAILNSLGFPGMFDRLDAIAKPSKSTCEWIFDHPALLQFEANKSPFLSIKGKMGSGKSVMMKHFYVKQQAKVAAVARQKPSLASFFFDAHGAKLNRSCEGFLRSVIFQLLQSSPDLLASLTAAWSTEKKASMLRGRTHWNLDDLQEFLNQMSQSPLWPATLIFVDALDEGEEEEIRPVIRYLTDLSESFGDERTPLLKCIMSCRHYPSIKIPRSIDIVMEDSNEQDIRMFVERELSYQNKMDQFHLANAVVERASGLFLWAALVTAILHRAADEDEPLSKKMERILQLPPKLEDLFTLMLSGLTDSEKQETYNILKWVTLGQRSLSCTELYFAVLVDEGTTIRSKTDWHRSPHFMRSPSQVENYLRSKSRGLIEFYGLAQNPGSSVQLIHDSVRVFLTDQGLSMLLRTNRDGNFIPHYQSMAVSCLKYLELPPLARTFYPDGIVTIPGDPDIPDLSRSNPPVPSITYNDDDKIPQHDASPVLQASKVTQNWNFEYPFLQYAADNVLSNFAIAEAHGCDQAWLVEHLASKQMLAVRLWFHHQRLLHLPDLDPQDLLQVAVFTDLHSCIHCILHLLRVQPMLATRYDKGRALYVAAATPKHKAMASLLWNQADAALSDGVGTTAFHLICRYGDLEALRILLHVNEGFDLEVRDVFGNTGLHEAAANGHVAVIQKLIAHGAKVNAATTSGESPLIMAARRGNESLEVVKCLHHAGADLEMKDSSSYTARDVALQHKNTAVRDFLDAQGAHRHTLAPLESDIMVTGTRTPAPPVWHIRSRDKEAKSSYSLLAALFRTPYELLSIDDQSVIQERKSTGRCYYCADPNHSIDDCYEYRNGYLGNLLYSNSVERDTHQRDIREVLLNLQTHKACLYCCYMDHSWESCAARRARIMILERLKESDFWTPWPSEEIATIESLNKDIDQSRIESTQPSYCVNIHPHAAE